MSPLTMQEARTAKMSEAEWQKRVTDLASLLGLKWHHETDSRRSKSGFPDLVIAGNTIVFAELKTNSGKVSPAQTEWLDRLALAKCEAYVWRPCDWPIIEARLRRLARV